MNERLKEREEESANTKSKESRNRSENCSIMSCALTKTFGYVSKVDFFLPVNPSYPICNKQKDNRYGSIEQFN